MILMLNLYVIKHWRDVLLRLLFKAEIMHRHDRGHPQYLGETIIKAGQFMTLPILLDYYKLIAPYISI